ncbi:uncharacterized protein L203_103141 [Cryptococcus depauperatus CBS 7841]|uniref:Endopeptidase S2P n=1 Tax=Cryptococcus depauperatus CBS 7841 TaxID=1295531 RepID=A0AAJ8JT53_9TREE
MLFALLLLPTALLVLLLYGVYHLTFLSSTGYNLPLHRPLLISGNSRSAPSFKGQWSVLCDPPWTYSICTVSLNNTPAWLLSILKFKNTRRLKQFYDLSIGIGLVGMTLGMLGIGWVSIDSWREVWGELGAHVGSSLLLEEPSTLVPLSHFPSLVFALVFNQLIHELGHALCAALDDVQPTRVSLNLSYLLPSMTVEFPSTIDALNPNAQMRIASSGPIHNLVTWLILRLLASSSLGSLFWQDRSGQGVVQEVAWKSPLAKHLQPGDTISHLNDIQLTLNGWTDYLHSAEPDNLFKGWCVNKDTFLTLPFTPCNDSRSLESIIFKPVDPQNPTPPRCLAPHPILDIPSTSSCPDDRWLLVRPLSESILRIRKSKNGKEKVVLWDGAREEVYKSVRIGMKGAKGWADGVWVFDLLLRYIKTIALSLFVFNLLPFPFTDGSQLLDSLLKWRTVQRSLEVHSLQATLDSSVATQVNNAQEYELASDEEGLIGVAESTFSKTLDDRREVKWKKRLRWSVNIYILSTSVSWVAAQAMIALLRSS